MPGADGSRLEEFQTSIERQRHTGPDIYTRAHDEGFANFLHESQTLRTIMGGFLATYPRLLPANAALRIPKSSQAMEMAADPSFPRGRDTAKAWTPTFERLVDDNDYRFEYLTNLLLPIASNVSERGKLLKATALLKAKEHPVSILDVGCSLNHTLKRLALQDEEGLAYNPTLVMSRPSDGELPRQVDKLSTVIFNQLIQDKTLILAPSLGMDLFDADRDEVFRNWARSNSFYMGELLERKRTEQFDRLVRSRPEQVRFWFKDITHCSEENDPQEESRQFDIVYLSTMLYQLDAQEVNTALENAARLVKPDGLIAVQDFVDFQADGPPHFYDKQDWRWNYGLWVKDMRQEADGFQKYFSVESGRVEKIIIEPEVGKLAAAQELELIPT